MGKAILSIGKKTGLSVLALFLIFEEWLWGALTALGGVLSRLLHLQKFEVWLTHASPRIAFFSFVLPILAVAPINILGLVLFAHGCFLRALLVEITGKLLWTLLVARVFRLTRPQLMTFGWFQWLYRKVSGWLDWAHARLTATATYRLAKAWSGRIGRIIKRKP